MKIHRLDHVHIHAQDPEGSARFYTDVFGAETIGTAQSSRGGTMHFVRLGGLPLVLASLPPGIEPARPPRTETARTGTASASLTSVSTSAA